MSLIIRPVKPAALSLHTQSFHPPVAVKVHPLPQRYTRETAIAWRMNHRALQTLPKPISPPQMIKRQFSTTHPVGYEKTIKGMVQAFAGNRIDFSLCVTGCVMEAVKDLNCNLSPTSQQGIELYSQEFNTAVSGARGLSADDIEVLKAAYKHTLHEMIKQRWAQQIAKEFNPIFKIHHPTKKAHAAVQWIDAFTAGVDYFYKGNAHSDNWMQLRDITLSVCPDSERNLLAKCVWFGHIFHIYKTSPEARVRLLTKNFQSGELS